MGRNRRTAVILLGVVPLMVGLTFASVPLYRLFCQVTGFGGTTQVAEAVPEAALEREITVRFNADTDPQLSVQFEPVERSMTLRVGEPGLAFYRATNLTDRPISTMATFNVTPLKAGRVFNKVHCFCFETQTIAAGQSVDMPVSFFVDPEIEENVNLNEVKTITLSYTLFEDIDATTTDATQTGASAGAAADAQVADLESVEGQFSAN